MREMALFKQVQVAVTIHVLQSSAMGGGFRQGVGSVESGSANYTGQVGSLAVFRVYS